MNEIKELYIDYETRSKADLPRTGVYKYVEDDDFKVLLASISINKGPVVVYDLTKEELPKTILDAIKNKDIKKYSFNVQFERKIINSFLRENNIKENELIIKYCPSSQPEKNSVFQSNKLIAAEWVKWLKQDKNQ